MQRQTDLKKVQVLCSLIFIHYLVLLQFRKVEILANILWKSFLRNTKCVNYQSCVTDCFARLKVDGGGVVSSRFIIVFTYSEDSYLHLDDESATFRKDLIKEAAIVSKIRDELHWKVSLYYLVWLKI